MKKNNLFKAIGIVILFYVLFSWIVPIIYSVAGIEGEVSNQIGLVSIFSVILETFSGFGSVVLFVFLVGAFYGVLKATGAYDKVIEFLTTEFKGAEKVALIAIMVIMAIISSVSGLDLGLLILFPLLIGVIVNLGYDKLVALSATFGATLIGVYGSTLAGTTYGINNSLLSLDAFDKILFKVLFLVLGLAALITFVIMYCKRNGMVFNNQKSVKSTKKLTASKNKKAVKKDVKKAVKKDEVKSEEVKKEKVKKEKGNRGPWGAIIVIDLLILAIFLGTTSWESIFGSNWFSSFHQTWTTFTIKEFDILNKLFGGVEALGTWTNPLRFQTYSMLLIIAMIAIAIIYRTSVKDTFEGFVDGLKSFVVPVIVTMLACSVFVLVYYNPVLSPVTNLLLEATSEFNVALSGLYSIINSIFYVDYYYFANTVLYTIPSIYDDSAVLSIISVMITNLYGLVMLIAPTSVLLLISLVISEVEYTTWVKYIWKLVLTLLIISFVIFSIMVLV